MFTKEEEDFIAYWEANRDKRKKFSRQLAFGLPAAAIFVVAIFVSFITGWHKRANEEMQAEQHAESSATIILVLVAAAIIIVVFTSVFSARVKWEQHEQRYRELLARKDQS